MTTTWQCAICRARGIVEHAAPAEEHEIRARIVEQHAIKQPTCAAVETQLWPVTEVAR